MATLVENILQEGADAARGLPAREASGSEFCGSDGLGGSNTAPKTSQMASVEGLSVHLEVAVEEMFDTLYTSAGAAGGGGRTSITGETFCVSQIAVRS